jgi:hypothetical protein
MPTPTSVVQVPQAPPPPPVFTPRVVLQGPGGEGQLELLQAQASALVRQLAGLRVQRNFLERQSRDVSGESARAQIDASRANLDVQIAQAQADLENVRAQIASHENIPMSHVAQGGQVIIQPQRSNPRVDPEMVIGLSFALLMAIVLPLSIGFARRLWRGKPQPAAAKVDEIAPRLDRLEHAVDAIAIEVERISEGQRFVTKVLAERPMAAAVAPAPMVGRADAVDAGLPDARQMLALGAGPAEPIRVAERQAARQMNTPH